MSTSGDSPFPPPSSGAPRPAPAGPVPPSAHPATGAQQPWGGYPTPTGSDASLAREKASTALAWGIAGAVAGGLAFLMALVAVGMQVLGTGMAFEEDYLGDEAYYGSVRGQVVGHTGGAALGGDRLASFVDAAEREAGWQLDEIDCPDTDAVSTSTVVVCTGSLDGSYEWTGAVLFEDDEGAFVVAEF